MPRPFSIGADPPPPLTLEQLAQKYRLPQNKLKLVKAFVARLVSDGAAHGSKASATMRGPAIVNGRRRSQLSRRLSDPKKK